MCIGSPRHSAGVHLAGECHPDRGPAVRFELSLAESATPWLCGGEAASAAPSRTAYDRGTKEPSGRREHGAFAAHHQRLSQYHRVLSARAARPPAAVAEQDRAKALASQPRACAQRHRKGDPLRRPRIRPLDARRRHLVLARRRSLAAARPPRDRQGGARGARRRRIQGSERGARRAGCLCRTARPLRGRLHC